jgi:dephospho-CoA kinase
VVEPGQPALRALVERFGAEILAPDGRLDRAELAARAFVTEETKQDLEAITHPAIAAEFLQRIADAPESAIVVHDVPLLVESKRGYEYQAVIVVVAPLELRLARLEARGVPRADAERRVALQASDEERVQVATWVIDNGGDLAALERQVDEIWLALLERASKNAPEGG